MKSIIKNEGTEFYQIVVINETFEEAFQTFNEILEEHNLAPVTVNEAKNDWRIKGGESNDELSMKVNHLLNELATELAAWQKTQ